MPRTRHAYLERQTRTSARFYRTVLQQEPAGVFSAIAEWGIAGRRPSKRHTIYRGPDRTVAITHLERVVATKCREDWQPGRDPARERSAPDHPRLHCVRDERLTIGRNKRVRLRYFLPVAGVGIGAVVVESACEEILYSYHERSQRVFSAIAAHLWPERPSEEQLAVYFRAPNKGRQEACYFATISWPTATKGWVSASLAHTDRARLEAATGPLGPAPRRPARRTNAAE